MKGTEVVVYSQKRSNRLRYILDEIFINRFQVKLRLTSDLKEYRSFGGPRINYSTKKLEEGFTIVPHGLLNSKKLNPVEFSKNQDGFPCLMSNEGNGNQIDFLSTCFYFLSLYQERLPHRTDMHGRFPSSESVQHRFHVLKKPIVDYLIYAFHAEFRSIYPEIREHLVKNISRPNITIDVDQLFYYKSKGLARSILGTMADLFRDPARLKQRLLVQHLGAKDPLDIYDKLIELCIKAKIKPTFFIQVGEPSRFDHNNPIHLPEVIQRINEIAIRSNVGIHPSYYSSDDNSERLENEVLRLRKVCSSSVNISRQHYLRWRLPSTLQRLVAMGINHDYSLIFSDQNGFRAGTALPFKFFDLQQDEVIDMTLHPTHFMDITSNRIHKDESAAFGEMMEIKNECDRFGATFCTMWHPETLVGITNQRSSMDLLKRLLENEMAQ